MTSRPIRPAALSLALFLGSAGVTHFTNPTFFTPMIPPALPGSRKAWVSGSGLSHSTSR